MAGVTAQQAQAIQDLERKARQDFEFACANLLWIRPKDEALCKLNLLWPQRYVYRRFLKPAWERKEALGLVVLKTRRIFMTTLFVAWLYHKIRWYKGLNAYILANDDPTLADVFGMAKRFHANMPEDLTPPVDKDNTELLSYAAPWDCSLRARVAKHEQIGRGTTLQAVLWDEAAFSPAPEVTLLGFLDAVPRTSASLLAINSTANGEGTWFQAIWNEMNKPGGSDLGGRRWQTVFLAAWQNPHNRLKNIAVHDLTEEETSLVECFHVDDAYLAWRRASINEYERLFPGTGMRSFRQENPNCVAGDTRVGTEKGLLRIAELGERGAHETRTGTIGGWAQTGQALVWQVETHLGYRIEATEDHQIKTPQCWRAIRQLKPGHTVLLTPPRFAEDEHTARWTSFGSVQCSLTITPDVALFLGYFMGDGSWSGTTLSTICTGEDTDVIAEVSRLYRDVWGLTPACRVIGKQRGGVEVRACSKRLTEVFERLGIIKHRKDRDRSWTRNVCVPDVIWRSPQPIVRAFLQGLFEADGFNAYGTPRIVLFSKYREFLRDVQLLLLGFGLTARLGHVRSKHMDGQTYTGQELDLRAAETRQFHEVIGFRSARKCGRTETQVAQGRGRPCKELVFQDTITRLTPTRFADVYDLGITEPHHSFDGNGLLVHNSPDEAFQSALDCIFPEDAMARLQAQQRPPATSYRLYQTGTWKYTLLEGQDTARAWQAYVWKVKDVDDDAPAPRLYVWEPPKRNYQYALGVDVGLGVGGDDSAVVVMRYPGWVTVAHYADNVTAPKQFSYVVGAIADWYGRGSESLPIVTVELNNAGILINTEIETMSMDYLLQPYVWEYWDKIGASQQSTKTGWLTTMQTKALMVGAANSMLMADVPVLPSAAVWADMRTTYEVKPGVYRTKGADLAMAWLLALVTCYRKYARYEWGQWADPSKKSQVYPDMPGRPDDDFEDTPYTEYDDPTLHDTKWLKLMRARDRGTAVIGLEGL